MMVPFPKAVRLRPRKTIYLEEQRNGMAWLATPAPINPNLPPQKRARSRAWNGLKKHEIGMDQPLPTKHLERLVRGILRRVWPQWCPKPGAGGIPLLRKRIIHFSISKFLEFRFLHRCSRDPRSPRFNVRRSRSK